MLNEAPGRNYGASALAFSPGFPAQSQGSKLPLVAFLFPGSGDEFGERRVEALRKGLQEGGFVEGTHYSLETRFAAGYQSRMPELARELQSLKPAVTVVTASVSAIRALEPSTPAVWAVDPVEIGVAQSYVRPGGMITGTSSMRSAVKTRSRKSASPCSKNSSRVSPAWGCSASIFRSSRASSRKR